MQHTCIFLFVGIPDSMQVSCKIFPSNRCSDYDLLAVVILIDYDFYIDVEYI